MTSKISFYSLRRENIKHRIGMILIVGFMFFAYLIEFLISVQNLWGQYYKELDIHKSITALSEPEINTGAIVILAAVLLAISGFRYLHSKKEVDFYHSLPVRRKTHLYIIMTNDLLIITVFLLLLLCSKCVIAAIAGYISKAFVMNTVWSFICYLLVFAAAYLTMALAMILTGQTFVGLLGFGVLAAYMPLILRNLYPYLASVFFRTYYSDTEWGTVLTYFSPVSLAGKLLIDYPVWTWKTHTTALAAICIWIVMISAIVFILFQKRPSEMAGKAMAFPKVNGILRILLVIPVSIYVGLYLYSATFSAARGWIIAGVIIGGFFTHGVIECIYRFDIRGLLACKKQMVLSVAAALIFVGLFWADVFGYDTYLPGKEETVSVLIDSGYTYYTDTLWGKERKGVSGSVKDEVLDILSEVVSKNDKNSEDYYEDGNRDGYFVYTVQYRLENGREKKRSYVLDSELKDSLMRQVFDTEEYREEHYSLYTCDLSCVTNIELSHFMGNIELKMTKEQQKELLRIYLKEFKELDYDIASTTIPFGRLVISCAGSEDDDVSYGYKAVSCSRIGESYYIYPSFKNTVEYLENMLNEKLLLSFEEAPVTRLDIWQYDEEGLDQGYDIEDKKFIQSIKGKLFGGNVLEGGENLYPLDTAFSLSATVETENGNEHITVYTDTETINKIKKIMRQKTR